MGQQMIRTNWKLPGYFGLLLLAMLIISVGVVDVSAQIKKGKRFEKKSNCLDCHKGSEFTGSQEHEPFAKQECLSCHKPHGMVGMLRLKKTGSELCYECHESTKFCPSTCVQR